MKEKKHNPKLQISDSIVCKVSLIIALFLIKSVRDKRQGYLTFCNKPKTKGKPNNGSNIEVISEKNAKML